MIQSLINVSFAIGTTFLFMVVIPAIVCRIKDSKSEKPKKYFPFEK